MSAPCVENCNCEPPIGASKSHKNGGWWIPLHASSSVVINTSLRWSRLRIWTFEIFAPRCFALLNRDVRIFSIYVIEQWFSITANENYLFFLHLFDTSFVPNIYLIIRIEEIRNALSGIIYFFRISYMCKIRLKKRLRITVVEYRFTTRSPSKEDNI